MKHLIILLLFGLGSCHIHYHIEPKEEPIKTNLDNRFYPIGSARIVNQKSSCSIIGCCVMHGATHYPIMLSESYTLDTSQNLLFIDDTIRHLGIGIDSTIIKLSINNLNSNQ